MPRGIAKNPEEKARKISEWSKSIWKKGRRPPCLGIKWSSEYKKKQSEIHKGEKSYNWKGGKPKCLECGKQLMAYSAKFCNRHARLGEKAYQWKGGISFEPYTVDWTITLKRSIRERDFYTCQLCKEPQGDRALDVHHIDYNKKNCDPNNLIALCRNCHAKTSHNRHYWQNYFQNA